MAREIGPLIPVIGCDRYSRKARKGLVAETIDKIPWFGQHCAVEDLMYTKGNSFLALE